jgi:hypothetical protein
METNVLWSVVFGALVVEALVNIVKSVEAQFSEDKPKPSVFYWVSLVAGLIFGPLIAWNFDVDLFALVGLEGRVPFVGAILTGLLLSRGSNILSDVLGLVNSWKSRPGG